ncbi:MAG: restriction endonuclease subunit S [Elusimicrobia bacterium]|nr:restriction endonuclease subunit S [Elusimicrobiota bacterium]MDY6039609.1 restriction endonuclease subunit S [Elusimicrobiaceae bacterium]
MVKLGDVCRVLSGTTPDTNNPAYWKGNLPWITPAEITEDSDIIFDTKRAISKEAVEKKGLPLLPKGTVLLSSRAPIGKVAIAGIDMYCNQGFKNLVCSDKIYNKYLYFFLKSKTKFLNSLGRGATFKEISKSIVENILIPCPNIQIQKQIAERLDKVRELIAQQKEQIAKLDLLIKSRFLDMFGDPITNPKNWPLFPLGKFISVSGGFAFPSSEFKESGLPIVRIGNINSGVFKDDHFVFYQENEKLRKYLVYPDDLVLSLTGTVGKDDYANICFIGKKYARYYLNQRNAKLVLTSNLDKTFIWQIFKSPEIKKRLTSLNRGVRQANISNQDILNLKVIYPDLFLQTQFANFVKSVEQQKEVFSARLFHLEILYKSLMQEYFG